jgi:hypothetical protein
MRIPVEVGVVVMGEEEVEGMEEERGDLRKLMD